jgi:hypothetical protein
VAVCLELLVHKLNVVHRSGHRIVSGRKQLWFVTVKQRCSLDSSDRLKCGTCGSSGAFGVVPESGLCLVYVNQ